LFNIEFDLLSFLQIAEAAIALNRRVMDKDVLSTFAGNKAEAFVTIEPLDGTSYTFRHCICLLWQFENLGVLFGSIGEQNKTTHVSNRELLALYIQYELTVILQGEE
jgi:hypothetical protein